MIPTELMELATKGGAILAPFLLFLWWFERDERKSAQAELKSIAKETTTAMVELKSAVGVLSSILNPRNQ